MTDEELIAATDLAIHDALRDQGTKFAAGEAALAVATPEIERRLNGRWQVNMDAIIKRERDNCRKERLEIERRLIERMRKWNENMGWDEDAERFDAALDAFAKEQGHG